MVNYPWLTNTVCVHLTSSYFGTRSFLPRNQIISRILWTVWLNIFIWARMIECCSDTCGSKQKNFVFINQFHFHSISIFCLFCYPNNTWQIYIFKWYNLLFVHWFCVCVLNHWFLGAWTGEEALIHVSIFTSLKSVFQQVAQTKGSVNFLAGSPIMSQRWLYCVSSCFKGSNFQVYYYHCWG